MDDGVIPNGVINDGRVVDASVISRVSDHLRRRHSTLVDSFAVVSVTEAGVEVTLVDVESGAAFASRRASGTSGADLDALISDHLVRAGRVDAPDSDEWTAELRLLSHRGRYRLAESDGTFIMGEKYVRLFRVTRRDVAQSTLACAERVPDAVAQCADSTGRTVSAMVFDSTHTVWPGLPELLAPVTDVPIVVLDDVTLALHDVAAEQEPTAARQPEPVAQTTDHVEVHRETVAEVAEDSVADVAADPVADVQGGAGAEVPGDSFVEAGRQQPPLDPPRRSVDNEFDVTDRIEPIRLAYSDQSAPAYLPTATLAHNAGLAHNVGFQHNAGFQYNVGFQHNAGFQYNVEDFYPADGFVPISPGIEPRGHDAAAVDETAVDETAVGGAAVDAPARRGRKKILIGVGALGVVGVALAATALGLSGGSASPSASSPVTATHSSTTTQLYADLADLNEARAPAATYVPPPPPPPRTEESQRAEQPRPRSNARPKPKPRAVIPLPGGLPPIVVP
ncbi:MULTISPECIES: hypothetical protein [Gordonia]|uniref:hypothetical protein n=1 Tax=Gordonia TaxID=2053 RepID=UPI002580FC7E|nr:MULTISPECIES: hypothetical protein [Gordonia]